MRGEGETIPGLNGDTMGVRVRILDGFDVRIFNEVGRDFVSVFELSGLPAEPAVELVWLIGTKEDCASVDGASML